MPTQSSKTFTYYTFRFDYDTVEQVEKVKALILRECPKYAIFDEVSDVVGKQHLQGKIGKCMSCEQIRKRFKAALPDYFVKTNYSIKEIKEEEAYDSYICKDGKVLINNVFTQDYIDSQVKKRVENVAKFEQKTKKICVKNFTESVASDFVRDHLYAVQQIQQGQNYFKPTDYEKEQLEAAYDLLLSFILKRLGKVAKVFDTNILQRMFNGIKNYIIQLDDESSKNFAKKVKFFLSYD